MSKQVQVALLLTGNELMSGDTVDSNSSRIALALGAQKIGVGKKITVGDDPALLSDCLLYTSPSPRDGLLSRMPSSA